MVDFSILDFIPLRNDGTPAEALRQAVHLAQRAEAWGYRRYWLAEHHNMPWIASAATAVMVGHIAEKTRHIRVGAGGIMLTNHVPLVVAEQFGTLESLYPGRIDLGLGRAPGAADRTVRALRRRPDALTSFPEDVLELQTLLGPPQPGQVVQAVPGAGSEVPLWILGSSLFSAELAAMLGLPFGFAGQFAPAAMAAALNLYRAKFRPSRQLDRPRVMIGVNVVAADSDAQARRLFTSVQRAFLGMKRDAPDRLQPPVESMDDLWSAAEKEDVEATLSCSFIGTPASIAPEIERFIAATAADEIIVINNLYSHAAQLHSFELLAGIAKALT
jgi:luciferase family oxidoreductase group 1